MRRPNDMAKQILGRGFFTSNMLMEEFGIAKTRARDVMGNWIRSSVYETEVSACAYTGRKKVKIIGMHEQKYKTGVFMENHETICKMLDERKTATQICEVVGGSINGLYDYMSKNGLRKADNRVIKKAKPKAALDLMVKQTDSQKLINSIFR